MDFHLAQLDTDLLIQEVKARPSLYSRDAPKHHDPIFKKHLWEEVASTLFANVWATCNDEEKAEKSDLVQRRWKNLRACFTRELKRQKDPKWIYGVAYKRRKYLYYNELYFLKSEFDKSNDEEPSHGIDLPEKSDVDNTKVTIDTNIEETPIPEAVKLPPSELNKTSILPAPTPEKISKDEADSTNFGLSLVPMLNMLPLAKRIDAQIAILSVLKRFHKDEDGSGRNKDGAGQFKNGAQRIKKGGSALKRSVKEFEVTPIEIKSEVESDDDDEPKFFRR